MPVEPHGISEVLTGVCLSVQGPKDSTVGDFWQMVYERNCAIVIMLTRLVESSTLKKASAWIFPKSMVKGLEAGFLLVHRYVAFSNTNSAPAADVTCIGQI